MATSGHPEQSYQIELMKNGNAQVWSPLIPRPLTVIMASIRINEGHEGQRGYCPYLAAEKNKCLRIEEIRAGHDYFFLRLHIVNDCSPNGAWRRSKGNLQAQEGSHLFYRQQWEVKVAGLAYELITCVVGKCTSVIQCIWYTITSSNQYGIV